MKFAHPFGAACLLALFLTGCKSTYSETNVTTAPPPVLHNNSRVYVAIPFDGSFKNKVAQNSGKQTAQAVLLAFTHYTRSVYLGKFAEGPEEALESARNAHVDYLVYPHLIKWEDHPTEWSGVRDRLELKIDVIEPADGKLVFSREINATGKWMSDGGDTPNDLLQEPVDDFVNALYRRFEKPSAF